MTFKDKFVAASMNIAMWLGFITLITDTLSGRFGTALIFGLIATLSAYLRR